MGRGDLVKLLAAREKEAETVLSCATPSHLSPESSLSVKGSRIGFTGGGLSNKLKDGSLYKIVTTRPLL
jgi:hypothetical protein